MWNRTLWSTLPLASIRYIYSLHVLQLDLQLFVVLLCLELVSHLLRQAHIDDLYYPPTYRLRGRETEGIHFDPDWHYDRIGC